MAALLLVGQTLTPQFSHPSSRPFRAFLFSILALTGLTYVVHGILLNGYETQRRRMSLDWMGRMCILNGSAAVVYATRVSGILSFQGFINTSVSTSTSHPPGLLPTLMSPMSNPAASLQPNANRLLRHPPPLSLTRKSSAD